MAVGLRATSVAGDAQSTAVSTLTITVPSTAVVGDIAIIVAQAASTTATLTTPAGWGTPDVVRRASRNSAWVFAKTIASGDIGANVSLAFSTSLRCDAICVVSSSVTGNVGGSFQQETVETSAPTLPGATGIPAGAFVLAVFCRAHTATDAPAITLPGGYTRAANSTSTAYGSSPQQTIASGWLTAATAGTYGGTGSSSPTSSGINLVLWLAPSLPASSPATAPNATATVTTSAAAGQATGAAAPRPYMGTPAYPPDPYRQAWRSGGLQIVHSVSATLAGAPVAGAQDLRPTGGTITDTTKPGVRRTLNLELAPDTALFEALTPLGTRLTVTAKVTVGSVPLIDIPMGVFVVDSQSITVGNGQMTLTAPDKWSLVQRARLLRPTPSDPGLLVTDQIAALIQGGIGKTESVISTASSQATVGTLTWDRDRDKAVLDLAESIGAWVYFDRQGQCVIADIPQLGTEADWLIDATQNGVLVSLDRQRSRSGTYNLVAVSSSAAAGEAFPVQWVWDGDPNSPTFAGVDPTNNPAGSGPFGVVPIFYSSPVLTSADQALLAGMSILSRVVGLSSSVSLSSVPNPAIDAFHVLDVLPPRATPNSGLVMERHVVDTVRHPLVFKESSPQQIEARSTRIDPYSSDVSG